MVDPQNGTNPFFKRCFGFLVEAGATSVSHNKLDKYLLQRTSTVVFRFNANNTYIHLQGQNVVYCFSARYSSPDNGPRQKPCPAVWPNPSLSSVSLATPSPPPHSVFPAPAPKTQVQKQLELVNRLC